MDWRDKIICDWPNDLQKAHRCKTALHDLERVLLELAGLGHPLHVEEGYQAPPPPGWPKARFHILQGSRVVHCQGDLDELGDDWYPTMEEARYAAGITKQYQRGGIFTKSLPSLMTQTPEQVKANMEAEYKKRADQKKFADDMRTINRAGFQAQTILIDHGKEPEHEPTVAERFDVMRGRK